MSSSRQSWYRPGARSLATATALSLAAFGLSAAPALADTADGTSDAVVDDAVAAVVADGGVFISELHYDNAGADSGESIEVQAPAGTDLTGWTLVLYNGNNGNSYDTDSLGGVVSAAGVVVVTYPSDGVQNGSPDGIALIDAAGAVVEFLSYEGSMTAANGPAAGVVSTDIGVSQTNSTPAGQSLQRIDGEWTGPAASSFGAINSSPDPVEPGGTVTIAEIQGTGDASPMVGEVVTTNGVVTAAYPSGGFNGYYIQTAGSGGDVDPSARTASDGLFIFSSSTVGLVEAGDSVEVTGQVVEFNGLTELSVGASGLTVLADEAEAPLPIVDFVLAGTNAGREPFEGMLVTPADRYVISDTYSLGGWGSAAFGSIGLGLDGPLVQETDVALPGTAEFDAAVADNVARTVTLDDGQSVVTSTSSSVPYLTGNPDVRTGVGLEFGAPVVLDYRFQWNFQPTAPVTGTGSEFVSFIGGNTQGANAAPEDVGGDVTLATFNVLNYFTTLGADLAGCDAFEDREGNPITVRGGCDARGAWDATNLQRQQDKIVTAINGLGADVVGLEEIENSVKFGDDRDAALATLVDALNAAAGEGTWAFAPSPSVLPTLAEQDVIRNAFIYRTANVTLDGESVVLTGSAAFSNAREPLAQAFTSVANPDYSFLAVSNHFKSKGGDCGDLPEGCFDSDRVAQSQALAAFAQSAVDAAGVDDIFLVGDFNSYSAENPIVALEAEGYTNVDGGSEPSYVFDGKIGSLDHVFANASAMARITGADVWRINADESVLAEYSRWNYFASEHVQLGSQFRASDHNPMIVGIDVPDVEPTGPTTIDLLSINDLHGRILGNTGQPAGAAVLACTVDSYRDANPNTVFVSAGDNIGASTFESAVANDQPTLDVLNAMGLQVSALGNHEFDKGQDDVNNRVIPDADFPYLAANIYNADGSRAYDPYATIDVAGVTIGFIGAMTEELPSLVAPSGIDGLEVGDITEAVNEVATDLTDGDPANGEADIVIALVHDGAATPDLSAAAGTPYGDLIAGVNDSVSAIISGHTHQAYAQKVGNVWVTQSAQYGEQIGHLQLVVDEAGEVSVTSAVNVDLVPSTGPICAGDPDIQAIVDEAVANASVLGAVPVGEITEDLRRGLQADGTENRGGESTIGNFVADVQLWAGEQSGAQIAFMNPGGIRTDLTYAASADEGDAVVTYKEAAQVQPFANTLVAMNLTGAQILQVLEQQWQPSSSSRPFLKLGVSEGFRYIYDPDAAAGERILAASLNGEPIEAGTSYRVIVNSFLASGGDNFSAFVDGTSRADSGQVDLDAMVGYFDAQTEPVSPDVVQRSVGLNWVSDPTATYAPGDEVSFDLSSLAFSQSEPKPTEVTVTIGGIEAGTAAVDPAIVSTTDETGRASVVVTIPEGTSGDVELVASDDVNGVVYSTTISVEDLVVDTTKPVATLVAPTTAGPFQTLSLQVDATDDVGLNRIVANIYSGKALVKSTQTPVNGAASGTHTATVTLPDGVYTIRYNASDLAGNIAKTGSFTVTIDGKAPTVTVKTGNGFTVGGPVEYDKISFKLYDAQQIDRFVLNGVSRDLVNNTWSDINYIAPGQFGAVVGANTLVVYDVAGNATTVTFTLSDPSPPPAPWEPWKAFAKFLWKLLLLLFSWWPWP